MCSSLEQQLSSHQCSLLGSMRLLRGCQTTLWEEYIMKIFRFIHTNQCLFKNWVLLTMQTAKIAFMKRFSKSLREQLFWFEHVRTFSPDRLKDNIFKHRLYTWEDLNERITKEILIIPIEMCRKSGKNTFINVFLLTAIIFLICW